MKLKKGDRFVIVGPYEELERFGLGDFKNTIQTVHKFWGPHVIYFKTDGKFEWGIPVENAIPEALYNSPLYQALL
jgi:hypothetical protein